MSNKILITGGAGFIGLHLAKRLLSEGFTVHIIDNLERAVFDKEMEEIAQNSNIKFFKLDLLSKESIDTLDKDFDFIFHLAAIIGVSHVLDKPYNVLYDNLIMLGNIIEFSHKQKNLSRLFFASTSEIYAGTLKNFNLQIPTPENTPLALTDLSHPRTSYMLSKIYGEALCQHSKLPFTIFRPHNIYGPRMGMSHVIPEQLYKSYNAKNGDYIEVFSSSHTRCFCYIDDAIEMLFRMMSNTKCSGMALNLGTQSPEVKMRDVAKICFSVVGKKLNIEEKPPSSGSPERRGPDMTNTVRLIDFESQVSLDSGILNTFNWYKKNVFEGSRISAK